MEERNVNRRKVRNSPTCENEVDPEGRTHGPKGTEQGLDVYLSIRMDEHTVPGPKTASKPDAIIFPAERGNPDVLPLRWEPTP